MRILSAIVGAAILVGCGAKDPDIAYTSDHMAYSRSAYETGRSDAQADLQAGRLVVEDYGFPRKGQQEYADILQERYHVELRRVASDIVDSKAYGHAFGYNAVSKPEIQRRYGADALEKAQAEAAEHYEAQQPK